MSKPSFHTYLVGLTLAFALACGDDTSGTGDAGEPMQEQNPPSSEAPASCDILAQVVGEYTVTGPATGNDQRGVSSADHARGTIRVAEDFAIDFDTEIAFEADAITTCYDRTTQDFDRRIQVSYDADDSGRVINLYLSDSLEVEEVQYRHSSDGVNIRAAVEPR